MRRSLSLFLFLFLFLGANAAVVRPAPNFTFPGIGKTKSLKSLRGQPVVLVIAKSPKTGDFKAQAKYLKEIYQQFASKQVVFVAAFTEETGVIKSDIPFAVADNGPAVAGAYEVADQFNIVIIGKDGNIDYQTKKVLPPERVRDVIQNSFEVQANTGR
jgi:peroxiredoxin